MHSPACSTTHHCIIRVIEMAKDFQEDVIRHTLHFGKGWYKDLRDLHKQGNT